MAWCDQLGRDTRHSKRNRQDEGRGNRERKRETGKDCDNIGWIPTGLKGFSHGVRAARSGLLYVCVCVCVAGVGAGYWPWGLYPKPPGQCSNITEELSHQELTHTRSSSFMCQLPLCVCVRVCVCVYVCVQAFQYTYLASLLRPTTFLLGKYPM